MWYQLTFLISSFLKQEEAEDFLKKIKDFFSQKEKILNTEDLKKIKLAYPIQKQREAYLASIDFQFSPEEIKNLKEWIEREKDILRYLLIKIREKRKKVSTKEKKREIKKLKLRKIITVSEDKKVELKNFEEKLEKLI